MCAASCDLGVVPGPLYILHTHSVVGLVLSVAGILSREQLEQETVAGGSLVVAAHVHTTYTQLWFLCRQNVPSPPCVWWVSGLAVLVTVLVSFPDARQHRAACE